MKKVKDYKKEEDEVFFAARIPRYKRKLVEIKMKKDKFKSIKQLINALIDKYLEEK